MLCRTSVHLYQATNVKVSEYQDGYPYKIKYDKTCSNYNLM